MLSPPDELPAIEDIIQRNIPPTNWKIPSKYAAMLTADLVEGERVIWIESPSIMQTAKSILYNPHGLPMVAAPIAPIALYLFVIYSLWLYGLSYEEIIFFVVGSMAAFFAVVLPLILAVSFSFEIVNVVTSERFITFNNTFLCGIRSEKIYFGDLTASRLRIAGNCFTSGSILHVGTVTNGPMDPIRFRWTGFYHVSNINEVERIIVALMRNSISMFSLALNEDAWEVPRELPLLKGIHGGVAYAMASTIGCFTLFCFFPLGFLSLWMLYNGAGLLPIIYWLLLYLLVMASICVQAVISYMYLPTVIKHLESRKVRTLNLQKVLGIRDPPNVD